MPVTRERAAAFDLGDPPKRLGVQEIGCAQHLSQVGLESLVVDSVEIVTLEFLDGGPKRAHAADAIEHAFDTP